MHTHPKTTAQKGSWGEMWVASWGGHGVNHQDTMFTHISAIHA